MGGCHNNHNGAKCPKRVCCRKQESANMRPSRWTPEVVSHEMFFGFWIPATQYAPIASDKNSSCVRRSMRTAEQNQTMNPRMPCDVSMCCPCCSLRAFFASSPSNVPIYCGLCVSNGFYQFHIRLRVDASRPPSIFALPISNFRCCAIFHCTCYTTFYCAFRGRQHLALTSCEGTCAEAVASCLSCCCRLSRCVDLLVAGLATQL